MLQKLKKFLLNFLILKKNAGWILLFSVVSGIFIPICYIYAGYWDIVFQAICPAYGAIKGVTSILTGVGVEFFSSLIAALFSILIIITSPFLLLSHSLLNWVISPGFVNISFTGPDNLVVQEGWGIVRDFVNMFIILGFVIVALATILRIKEYQAQKLLPLLIGIALLINFTPVICGFFIDISNVAMNYFLTDLTLDRSFLDTINYQINSISIDNPESALGTGIVFAGFNLIAGTIFLLFAFLFAARYVALWILIILSPLAFFCYVIPAAKGIWSMWWKQFFQWCIIGIPAAFFIYLSNTLIAEMTKGNLTGDPSGDLNAFATLFQYTVPLVFLVIGFFVSLQTGAIGADKIISSAKTGGTYAGRWAGRKGLAAGKFAGRGAAGWALGTKTGERIRGWGERQAVAKTPGAAEKGLKAKAIWGVTAMPWAIRRKVGRTITPLPEAERTIADKAHQEAKKKDWTTNLSDFRGAIDPAKKEGILKAMIEEKQMKPALNKEGLKGQELKKEEIMKVYKKAIEMKDRGAYESIERAYIKEGWKDMEKIAFKKGIVTKKNLAEKGYKDYKEAIIGGATSAEDIKQLQKGWWEDKDLMEASHKFWGGHQIGEAARTFAREFVDKFQDSAEERGAKSYLKPENLNLKIPNYLNSSAAQGLGFSSITEGERITDKYAQEKVGKTLKELREEQKKIIDTEIEKVEKFERLAKAEIKPKIEKEGFTGGARP
ncbi:hypothetical protein KAU51_03275 [Candidatus Parcubacteria bacterium]|nr:hypothetical protein [Candidatus Parcubacteria bacterium]